MAMSPNCVDTEQIPSKMVAGDREILGIGENPKSFGESRLVPFTRSSAYGTASTRSGSCRTTRLSTRGPATNSRYYSPPDPSAGYHWRRPIGPDMTSYSCS